MNTSTREVSSTEPVQIPVYNGTEKPEISEISYGPLTLVMKQGQFYIVAISSKNGTEGSFGIPKGKVNRNEYTCKPGKYIEASSKVSEEEFLEETGIDLTKEKILKRFRDIFYEERNIYRYKDGEKAGEIKEISNKTVVFQPMIVAFGLKLINDLAEGKIHNDTEADGGYSKNKERLVKLIPISEVDKWLKSEQLPVVKEFLDNLKNEEAFGESVIARTKEYEKTNKDKIFLKLAKKLNQKYKTTGIDNFKKIINTLIQEISKNPLKISKEDFEKFKYINQKIQNSEKLNDAQAPTKDELYFVNAIAQIYTE